MCESNQITGRNFHLRNKNIDSNINIISKKKQYQYHDIGKKNNINIMILVKSQYQYHDIGFSISNDITQPCLGS